jgi:hypothetical protein
MNEEALKLRAEALEWWNTLSGDTKRELVIKHFPDKSPMLVVKSSMMVERLFIKEKTNKI